VGEFTDDVAVAATGETTETAAVDGGGEVGPSRRLVLSLTLVTLSTLCIELLLSRLISLLFLSGDAYWIIAVALLGFGTGGALLAAGGERLARRADQWLPWLAGLVGLSAVSAVLLFRTIGPRIETLQLFQSATAVFLGVSLACLVPFLLASLFISLVFMRHRSNIGRLYFFDLLGAGLGCLVFVGLLRVVGAELGLVVAALLSLLAAAVLLWPFTPRRCLALALAGAFLLGAGGLMRGPSPLLPLVARDLRMLHDFQPQAVLDFQAWDLCARIDIVDVRGEPLKDFDGARYKLLTQDGGAPSILLSFDKPFKSLSYPDRSLLGIGYWTKKAPAVLIIGPGGGPDVATALRYGPRAVTAVELNRTTIRIVRDRFASFVGGLYQQPGVRVVHDDGRHFVRSSDERFDVIQLTGVDTAALGAAGTVQNFSENYLYTLEAFGDYFDHLTPDGILSLGYPNYLPWGMRALVTLLQMLHDKGVAHPEKHLVISMSGGYVSFLAKRSPFTEREVRTIESHFSRPHVGLLLPLYYRLWGQHLPENVATLYVSKEFLELQGLLHDPFTRRGSAFALWVEVWAEAANPASFFATYRGARPARDDQPFFFLPFATGWVFAERLLWLAVPVALFILAPLAVFRRRGLAVGRAPAFATYFACLGVAFIALEMSLLQKFILFLGQPAYSFAVVLGALLLSAGAGSLLTGFITRAPLKGILIGVAGISALILAHVLLADMVTARLLRQPLPVRVLVAIAMVFPLGVFMGMLFPNGIRLLGDRSETFVPWAWGINGSASVVGTVLSLYLAIEIGFARLFLTALLLYLIAALAASRMAREPCALPAKQPIGPPAGRRGRGSNPPPID